MLQILTVGAVTSRIQDLLEGDSVLSDVWIRGEVASCTKATSGHVYFTLKEIGSQVRCVLFRGNIRARTKLPSSGDSVIVHGQVTVYAARGEYQIMVDVVQPAGVGLLFLKFEELRGRLEAEGLFDLARKRPLPAHPRRIGVVTSASGAVFHDITNVLSRRYPMVEVVLAPTLVQGDKAPAGIREALRRLGELGDIDLVILARGGGSLEDLWAFNDEAVARAIFASPVPVISAVGHETDYTIADFVADLRAPTPSAAAELAVPDQAELLASVAALRARLTEVVLGQIVERRRDVGVFASAVEGCSPGRLLAQRRQEIDSLVARCRRGTHHRLALERARLRADQLQLGALSPSEVLGRGFSLCTIESTGRIVRQAGEVQIGDRLAVRVAVGEFPVIACSPRAGTLAHEALG